MSRDRSVCVCVGNKPLVSFSSKFLVVVKREFPTASKSSSCLSDQDVLVGFAGRISWSSVVDADGPPEFRLFHISDVSFSPYRLDLLEMVARDPENLLVSWGFHILPSEDFELKGESSGVLHAESIDAPFTCWDMLVTLSPALQWCAVFFDVVSDRQLLPAFRPDGLAFRLRSKKLYPLFKLPTKKGGLDPLLAWAKGAGHAPPGCPVCPIEDELLLALADEAEDPEPDPDPSEDSGLVDY